MSRFKITLEYDGTRFSGWQVQQNAKTIQGEFFKACEALFGTKTFEFYGSSRTDSGVHALEQVAHLEVETLIPPHNLRIKLNDELPNEISVLNVEKVSPKFHARFDATARSYVYLISRRKTAFAKPYVWYMKHELDTVAMQAAARILEGFHDFRSFTADDPEEKSMDVEMKCIDLYELEDLIVVHVVGSHFLWRMVRRIVGALSEVGRGNMKPSEIIAMMEAGKEAKQFSAPANGLFLEKVYYPGEEVLRGEEAFKLPVLL